MEQAALIIGGLWAIGAWGCFLYFHYADIPDAPPEYEPYRVQGNVVPIKNRRQYRD